MLRAAIAVAGAAAQRRPDAYNETLTKALLSPDPELRRIAFASVKNLGERGRGLFQAALAKASEGPIKRALTDQVAAVGGEEDGRSVTSAVALISDQNTPDLLQARAKRRLETSIIKEPAETTTAVLALIGNERADAAQRVWAIELLYDQDPVPPVPQLVETVRGAWNSKSPTVRNAALPLWARVDTERATGELLNMMDDKKLEKPLKVKTALAWGEAARRKESLAAAQTALDRMLKDGDNEIRAAAAEGAGRAGRVYQEQLTKMVKGEVHSVRLGAARGLAASAAVGARADIATFGISQLWREKGRSRRDALRVFADLARKRPGAVLTYLIGAARSTEDPLLHVIAAEGLCNAAMINSPEARRELTRSADDKDEAVRKLVMKCVADGPEPAKNGAVIAMKLARDSNEEIRADAARVIALAAGKGGKVPQGIGEALVTLLDDNNRAVRLIAIRAIAALGEEAPKGAAERMAKLFGPADEGEKLTLLRAARQTGAQQIIDAAMEDKASMVRVEAVDAALGSGLDPSSTLLSALADNDPVVRKAALDRIARRDQKTKLDPDTLDRALALAVRDPNPELSQLALTTIARVTVKQDDVAARLRRTLASRAERDRVQAAAAAIGLVERAPKLTAELLDPLLEDPSHDVRVAMLPALGAAYAKLNDGEKLAELLNDSETNAMRRIVIAAAFVTLAKTDGGQKAALTTLAKVAEDGPPMARSIAKTTAGLIAGKADGMAFLQELVP